MHNKKYAIVVTLQNLNYKEHQFPTIMIQEFSQYSIDINNVEQMAIVFSL